MGALQFLLPVLFNQFSGQERGIAVQYATPFFAAENKRVGSPLSDQQIADTVNNLVTLGIAEESNLINALTVKK